MLDIIACKFSFTKKYQIESLFAVMFAASEHFNSSMDHHSSKSQLGFQYIFVRVLWMKFSISKVKLSLSFRARAAKQSET